MKTVVGYSPYVSAGLPKAPLLLGGIVALIVAGAAVAGIANISESTTTSSPSTSASSTPTSAQQMDYEMGYSAGEVNLGSYPNVVALVQQKALCRASYQFDARTARQIPGLSISEPDYLAGCYAAVGAS